MSVGTLIKNAYAGSLAAIIVGVLLLLVSVFLLMRRGRKGRPVQSTATARGGVRETGPASDQQPADADAARRVERRALRRPVRLALLVAPVALVARCAVTPTAVTSWDPKTVSKPALTAAGAAALWKAYDMNNNAAIKAAAAPTYNAKGWDAADTDAVLLADRYETARNVWPTTRPGRRRSSTPRWPSLHRQPGPTPWWRSSRRPSAPPRPRRGPTPRPSCCP